jgi:drug/metabolite transporter (DMT)-like permease
VGLGVAALWRRRSPGGPLRQGMTRQRLTRHGTPKQGIAALRSPRLLGIVAGTAFASTYLGIWLQQISLKYAATGIAQALSSTSPLFVTLLLLGLGEKVSGRAIGGVLVALVGIGLMINATYAAHP